uniref:Uncharacterized protein n=1 Tax=Arundo donax TaxID=35708 RepID=A0A0A9AN63_ARUDO
MILLFLGIMEWTTEHLERTKEAEKTSKGVQAKLEAQLTSTSSPSRDSGAACTNFIAQIASELYF